jgi:hypothetical protein
VERNKRDRAGELKLSRHLGEQLMDQEGRESEEGIRLRRVMEKGLFSALETQFNRRKATVRYWVISAKNMLRGVLLNFNMT